MGLLLNSSRRTQGSRFSLEEYNLSSLFSSSCQSHWEKLSLDSTAKAGRLSLREVAVNGSGGSRQSVEHRSQAESKGAAAGHSAECWLCGAGPSVARPSNFTRIVINSNGF